MRSAKFLNQRGVVLASDWVPDEEGQADQDDHGGNDGKEDPDAKQGMDGLLDVGDIAEQPQRPPADRYPERTGELAQECPQPVVDALASFAGHLFVVFDHVGQHAPGEDPLGRKAHARHRGYGVDERSGTMREEEAGHHRQRGNEQAQCIRRTFVDPIGDQLGWDEEDADRDQHHQQYERDLFLHVQLVLDEIRHQGGQHREAETAQYKGDHEDDERSVLKGDQDGLDWWDLGWFPSQVGAFLQRQAGHQGGGHGDNAEDCPGGAPGLLHVQSGALEDTCQHGGERCAQDIPEDTEDHADGSQAGALVVIPGQLGGQGIIGHGGHGVEGIHQPEAEQDGQEGCYTRKTLGKENMMQAAMPSGTAPITM